MTTATTHAPFLNLESFSVAEREPAPPVPGPMTSARSPFLSLYEGEAGASAFDTPMREAFATLVEELHDEEFDEALFELQCSARAMHDGQLAAGRPRAEADRLVTQHFAQLVRESEAMVDAMAREFAPREQAGIVEGEIDTFLEAYAPSGAVEPEFENFLGRFGAKLGRFAKAAAGKALQGIKNVALGPLFAQFRKVVRPMLNAVVQRALGSIRPDLQPAAQLLAQKLGFGAVRPAPPASEPAPAPDRKSVV